MGYILHLCGNITLYVQDLNLSFLSCDSMLVQYRADPQTTIHCSVNMMFVVIIIFQF